MSNFDFVIFDLDGTLSDHSHRLHLVTGEAKDYDQYYDLCDQDPPRWPVIHILQHLVLAGNIVEIWTGRPKRLLDKSVIWLKNHDVSPALLKRMRSNDDFTPDKDLKGGWLERCSVRPTIVFEDRPHMVEFWRSQGIFCFDVGGGQENEEQGDIYTAAANLMGVSRPEAKTALLKEMYNNK